MIFKRIVPFWVVILIVASVLMMVSGAQPVRPVFAQGDSPGGVIAFVGSDAVAARIIVVEAATGQTGQIETPVLPEADLAWQPGGTMLAFTTTGGNYGVMTSTAGCFKAPFICSNVKLFDPAESVLGIEWTPDGAWLLLVHEDSIKVVRPATSSLSVALSIEAACGNGLLMRGEEESELLLCASPDTAGTSLSINEFGAVSGTDIPLELVHELGTYPAITALAMDDIGRVIVGTSESGGESAWITTPGNTMGRISTSQIHVADAGFTSDLLVLVAAVADSTGDATLRDGDSGELFLYDFPMGELTQVPGFGGAMVIATSPDSELVLVVSEEQGIAFFDPSTQARTSVMMSAGFPGMEIVSAAWQPGAGSQAPLPLATRAPVATIAPLPTFTPFVPVVVSTNTPIPAGVGCQFAIGGETGAWPFALGETAEVTPWGTGLRMRSGAGRGYSTIRELPAGTRMTVLSGPVCMDGYRWWQFRLSDGTIGWAADSDGGGWWTIRATTVAEVINFFADRTTITAGECVSLQWSVSGIKEVYYQGSGTLNEGVTGTGARTECPPVTTTYSLRVVRTNDTTTIPTVTITVGAAPVPTPPPTVLALAELFVSEFALNPAVPIQGNTVAVRVGVYNQGTAASGPFHVDWYPGEYYPSPACSWDIDHMAAGGGRILTCDYAGYPSSYASINTMVKVDTANAVVESNETNNTYMKAINVN